MVEGDAEWGQVGFVVDGCGGVDDCAEMCCGCCCDFIGCLPEFLFCESSLCFAEIAIVEQAHEVVEGVLSVGLAADEAVEEKAYDWAFDVVGDDGLATVGIVVEEVEPDVVG